MKLILRCALIFFAQYGFAQVTLDADGPGDTYELISSVLAPGYDPIEEPDCDHDEFGRHIDEVFDADLNAHAFRFFLHVTPDNDRCINFDRQRNEIKSYNQSPDNLLGVEEEIVVYKWKFKLPEGFQSSTSFNHIHQLKSVGGPFSSHPMYTLTTRLGSPDRIELRYGEVSSSSIIEQTPLEPFINTWVKATEIITYGVNGTYEITLNRVSDNAVLLSYATDDIINWREDADFVRPKWGIYRSLNNSQNLRDEEVLFANFSIEEVESLAIEDSEHFPNISIFMNPETQLLSVQNIPTAIQSITVFTIEGKKALTSVNPVGNEMSLDTSTLSPGTYILSFNGAQITFSKMVILK